MSGKSKRRGRHMSRSQRKKTGREGFAPVARPPTAERTAPSPQAVAPVSAKAPAPKTALVEPLHISGELKRIGLVGGVMVVLLVVSYFVLPLIL